VKDGALRVTVINHATSLVQMDGMNFLTDPIWSERCSPVAFAGPRRVRPPGIRFEDLPPIDAVLISHNHYDHLDIATLQRLQRERGPRFFVGLGNGALLRDHGIGPVQEVDWWQGFDVGHGVTVYSVPTQHFANRGLGDFDATLWTGYLVKGPSGSAYFAGDTGFGDHFAHVRARFGAPRVALLPIGAFRPEWFMGPIHMSPHQAFQAHQILGAETSVAIHFGTFPLADDGETEAPDLLRAEVAKNEGANTFIVPEFGRGYDVPAQSERRAPTERAPAVAR
jgi:L-ascorbate metabolism protein UlaG (beta-lactamase superfamily)